jgi:hypothetical protein
VSTDVSEEHIASIFRVEKISSATNQPASRRWVRYVRPNPRLTHYGLHGVISQKLVLFKTYWSEDLEVGEFLEDKDLDGTGIKMYFNEMRCDGVE